MEQENNKIEFSEPMGMMAIVTAVMADLMTLIFLFALGIPGIGIIFFSFGIAIHYVGAVILTILLWDKFKGVFTKLVVSAIWFLPFSIVLIFPLSIGIVVGRLLSNKVIRMVAEQVAIQAIAVATGGAGEALEAGVVAGRAAEAGAQIAARGAEAGAQAAGRAAVTGEQAILRGGQQAAERAGQAGERAVTRPGLQEQPFREAPKEPELEKPPAKEKYGGKRPEEIAEKAFEKMEEMSEEEEDDSSEVVDLSEERRG